MPLQTFEERLTHLEETVQALLSTSENLKVKAPWWKRHVGAFMDSPYYENAMMLGEEYRKSQPKEDEEKSDDVPS